MIDDNFNSFHQSAMARSDGDSIKAEMLLDCSVYGYFYRVYQYKLWADERERQMKAKTQQ